MNSNKSQYPSIRNEVCMAGINFQEGRENPVILLYSRDEYQKEWNYFISTISSTHQIYLYPLVITGHNGYHAIEHATKGILYKMLADPILRIKEVVIVIHLRILDFQEDTTAAIFVDHRSLRGLLESYLDQKLNNTVAERVLFPSSIVSVLKDTPAQSVVDSITFINDTLSFFVMKRLSDLLILNKYRLRIYFLDLIVNKKLIRSRVAMDMISILERLRVSKAPGTSG